MDVLLYSIPSTNWLILELAIETLLQMQCKDTEGCSNMRGNKGGTVFKRFWVRARNKSLLRVWLKTIICYLWFCGLAGFSWAVFLVLCGVPHAAAFSWSLAIVGPSNMASRPRVPLHVAPTHSVIWLELPYSMPVVLQEGEGKSCQSSHSLVQDSQDILSANFEWWERVIRWAGPPDSTLHVRSSRHRWKNCRPSTTVSLRKTEVLLPWDVGPSNAHYLSVPCSCFCLSHCWIAGWGVLYFFCSWAFQLKGQSQMLDNSFPANQASLDTSQDIRDRFLYLLLTFRI